MNIIQFPKEMNHTIMNMALKADEKIVCTNATVIMDSKGNLSYYRNNTPMCVITEDNNG